MDELYNENLFSQRFRIKTTRLQKWDYSSLGYYFITICTFYRENYFGFIENNKIILSAMGKIIKKHWQNLPNFYPNIELDEYIIMPNHFHGIIRIVETINEKNRSVVETIHELSLRIQQSLRINRRKMLLPKIIGRFKMQSSKEINVLRNRSKISIWKSRFYDHIIRNEIELNKIRQYIINNPQNWKFDRNNL